MKVIYSRGLLVSVLDHLKDHCWPDTLAVRCVQQMARYYVLYVLVL